MCLITTVFQILCSFKVFTTVVTLYKDFFQNFRGFHFIRKLFIHSFYYRNIPRFVTFFKYLFYYFRSFCFISRLFILSFFHRNLVRFVKATFIYPCSFSSHLTWRLFVNRTGTFEQLLVKLESIHAHRKLEQKLFLSQRVSGRKPDTFQTKLVPSFSQTKVTSPKSMSETNILNKNLGARVMHCCQFKGLTATWCESKIY